jgi:hypothetical protein
MEAARTSSSDMAIVFIDISMVRKLLLCQSGIGKSKHSEIAVSTSTVTHGTFEAG